MKKITVRLDDKVWEQYKLLLMRDNNKSMNQDLNEFILKRIEGENKMKLTVDMINATYANYENGNLDFEFRLDDGKMVYLTNVVVPEGLTDENFDALITDEFIEEVQKEHEIEY